jgi:hypothetical protein
MLSQQDLAVLSIANIKYQFEQKLNIRQLVSFNQLIGCNIEATFTNLPDAVSGKSINKTHFTNAIFCKLETRDFN